MQYDDVITNPTWRTDAIFFYAIHGHHIIAIFRLYLGVILADQREIWNIDEGSYADIVHVTKAVISQIQDGGPPPF